MENHYNCIYMYKNKINGKGYVGQTVNFNKRHKEHISAMTNENNDEYDYPIHRALRKYGLDNFKVEILKENLNTQCLLNFYECYYIKKFNLLCKNGKGYNLSDGGSNGNPYAGKTEEEMEETKRKISESMKGENAPWYGKHLSESAKQKMSEAHNGENNSRAKCVVQYDKQGNIIKIWDYAKQVTEELNINQSHIVACCKFWEIGCNKEEWFKTHKNYPYKSCGGYIWKYADTE